MGPLANYTRPEIPDQVFRDADGHVIPFGTRWGNGLKTPDGAYSVVANPERFDPVVTIVEAPMRA